MDIPNNNDEYYYKLYTMHNRDANLIVDYCIYLEIPLDTFLEHVVDYINKNLLIPNYVNILNHLATLSDNQSVINYLNSIDIDYKVLRNNLMDYFINFRPDIYYTNELIKKRINDNLTMYETYKARLNKPSNCEKTDINEYIYSLITEYIESDYSVNRFCFNKNIGKTLFSQYLIKIKTANPNLYNKYLESTNLKEQIKNAEIENDVYKILNEIKENPNFSIIDFLLMTNYDVLELIKVADKILSMEDVKLFRIKIKSIRFINKLNEKDINHIINSSFTFNVNEELITLSREDNIIIINYLKENNIPISNDTFKDACIKYLNNTLIKGYSK